MFHVPAHKFVPAPVVPPALLKSIADRFEAFNVFYQSREKIQSPKKV